MRGFWGALFVATMLALMPVALSHAVFPGSGGGDSNVFSSGTIDLASSPASVLVSLSGMAPGDAVTAPITVSNLGTSGLRYTLSTTISGDALLADALMLKIRRGVPDCSASGFASGGPEVYEGPLPHGAIEGAAQGADPGDRTLEPSESEDLCFQVLLPTSAGNTLQGLAATATFTFDAEQTAGNRQPAPR